MNAEKTAVIALLDDMTRAVRKMSPDEFEQLLKGKLHPSISFTQNDTEPNTNSRNANRKKSVLRKISAVDFPAIRAKLDVAKTREDGYYILQQSFSDKSSLYEFSRYLDVNTQSRDSIARIQDNIIAFMVGHRLAHEAILNSGRSR